MYSQGSYNSHSGQSSQTSITPPYLHRPPAQHHPPPPPPPHNFHQSPPAPLPHVPPRLGQPGLPVYQQCTLAQHLPRGGIPNPGQSYLRPPPTVPHAYTTSQQHSSHLAPGPPPPLHASGSYCPEMLHMPLPPRFLHAPHSQGQMLYRGQMHQLPQQPGGLQCLQHIPPPPTSSFSTSTPSGSSAESPIQNFQMSATAPPPPLPPPPLPPPPPPIPPSSLSNSPLMSLSTPQHTASNKPCNSDSDTNSRKVSGLKLGTSGSVAEVTCNIPMHDGNLCVKDGTGSEVDYLGEDAVRRSVILNVSPPPKPAEEKIVKKIEELCQLIAKNGSSYEGVICQNESGNPDFKFLYGGEPGSEAAIAYEYFMWMKKQCTLPCKLDERKTHSSTRPLRNEYSMQPNHLMAAAGSLSPADSDMEMEDDITESENDRAVNDPIKGPLHTCDLIGNEFNVRDQLHPPQSLAEYDAGMVVLSEKVSVSGSSGIGEQESKLISMHDHLPSGKLVSEVHSPVIISAGAAEFRITSNAENSTTALAGYKALAGAECINSDKSSGQVIKGDSPFRLLQDYASDDSSENDEEPCPKEAIPTTDSPLVTVGAENSLNGTGFNENRASISYAASPKAFPKEGASGGAFVSIAYSAKHQKDNKDQSATFTSNTQKIDKFGRLLREGASDSDSDDSQYAGRRNRRRKSRSRSQSPLDRRRRRRRRSPGRRRHNRSQSRSRSPRNRRSRSRSPSFRHTGDFSSGNLRRDKGQMPDCFDFLRGRCYRGASCRYLHHDSQKSDGSSYHRNKEHYPQPAPGSKNSSTREEMKKTSQKVSDHEIMSQEMQVSHDVPATSFCAAKNSKTDYKNGNYVSDILQYVISNEEGVHGSIIKSDCSKEAAAKLPETILVQEEPEDCTTHADENFKEEPESGRQLAVYTFPSEPVGDANILRSHEEDSENVLSSLKDSAIHHSQSDLSDSVLEHAHPRPQQATDSYIVGSSEERTSKTSQSKLHASETVSTSTDSAHNPSQMLSLPLSASVSEAVNAAHVTQPQRDSTLMPQPAAFQSQSAPLAVFPPYMLPNQNSLFFVPANSSWASLPPPPLPLPPYDSTVNAGPVPPSASLQFQQSYLPPRNEFGSQMFLKPYSTELPDHSRTDEYQHQAYTPVQERHQSPLHVEDFRKPLSRCNSSNQQFGGPSLLGEDHLTQLPMQGLSTSKPCSLRNSYRQPMSSTQESSASTMRSFPSDGLPPGDILKSASQVHPYLQQQRPPIGLSHSVPDGVYGLSGKISSSRYPPDVLDTNQPSFLSYFGVSRTSTHYNPYASTFEQPLSSGFGSDVFGQEEDRPYASKYGNPLNHASIDGHGGSLGSRQTACSPNSARASGPIIPRTGNEQYDPLFDSIEPSSNPLKKFDHIQKWEASADSTIMLRLSGSNKPLDVEENNLKKDGGIALATSLDNEEFGETADGDAEVGDGEMEIDQIKSPGKSKKSKESRSVKLFKVALADFVKEVLKPSWRQGNMSKEAFKTVVKKTVDKVSEAMKSHQMPKSKKKINQYIDSSQRKLTKLVMGYVDKYAKG